MERVTGFGGLFFYAKNPGKLADWYEQHLGIAKVPQSYDEESWWQDEGPTVFAPFNEENEFLHKFKKSLVLNFRVKDLDAMINQLTDAGIEVTVDPEQYPNGRFADFRDPEGNPIQLWQPEGIDRKEPG